VADAVTWKIIEHLARIKKALHTRGTPDQRLNNTLADTVALVVSAKVHLALWGNGGRAAAIELGRSGGGTGT